MGEARALVFLVPLALVLLLQEVDVVPAEHLHELGAPEAAGEVGEGV
ncbi:hypothetical protein [Streptomyces sp. AC512_CC834]|nr:hypothetical protein [Streptomyces sp. AC512_CC834]